MVATREPVKQEYQVIGTRPIRHDGVDKVTGRAIYGADVRPAGLLYGVVVRGPHAHARIKQIDTSRAAALPGVKAVMTAADLPALGDQMAEIGEAMANLRHVSGNILARDKVLYRGHAVAAVAATSRRVAEEAAALIRVEYEVLTPVLDVRAALAPDAAILHEEGFPQRKGAPAPATPTNLAGETHFEQGNLAAGFAAADFVVEREFTTKMVHQGYIETHNATAHWGPDGQITIWTSTQGAFGVRNLCAAILDQPVSRIKVVPLEIGGGFGGKTVVYLEPVAAALSRLTGRPVKLWMSRADVFEGTGPTSGTVVKVTAGCRRDGTLTAAQAELTYEAGAYPASPVALGMMCIFACYNIPAQKADGYDVVVNKPRVAAYRAPGAPAAAFAMEQVVDELARLCGIDPLQFRLKNAAVESTRMITGRPHRAIGNAECMQAILDSPHYQSPLEPSPDPAKKRGRGVAAGFWFNATTKAAVVASVNLDGTVSLTEGSTDIGGTRTSIAMQLAEALGIAVEQVKPQVVDTDSIGYTDVTGGSRTTFGTGWAAYEAAQDIRRQLVERAAKIWEVKLEEVVDENSGLRCLSDEAKTMTFAQIAAQLNKTGAPIVGRATVSPRGVGAAFSVQCADVEVDTETGKVEILRYTITQDVGRAVHPSYVEGQMQGGAVQGIGWALNEEYAYDPTGRMLNASFLDYRMPTALDVPLIETIITEVPNPGHPYGVRGVGEVGIVPPMAAIANAVHDAIGHRFTDLPISPGRVLDALHGDGSA